MHTCKIDTKKLSLLAIPEGYRMRIKHYYEIPIPRQIHSASNLSSMHEEEGPKKLYATSATLEDPNGNLICEAEAIVNPKDTPIKKLGRAIAHNRCMIKYKAEQQAAVETM